MSLLTTASLVVTPNAGKEGTLFSIVPDTGLGDLSVTRATTATRVNSQGLVELVPYNLAQYSEDYTNAYWNKINVSVTSNSTTAPNGTNTADTITDTSSGSLYFATSANVNTGEIITYSQYVKYVNNDWFYLGIARSGVTPYGEVVAFFNINTGVTGANLTYGIGVFVSSNIENVGNGWYRCSITAYVPLAAAYVFYTGNANANGVPFSSSVGDASYQWGAQLVEGSVAKDYQKTETRLNIPRLDYSNGTCPSILVEPQRTNLLTYSSSFDNSAWVKYYASANINATTSPSGIQDADKLVETSYNNIHLIIQGTLWNTNARTATIYAKADERTKIYIANTSNIQGSFFNLANGTIEGNIGSFTSTIEDVGNGWYRCTATHTAAASNTFAIGIYTTYTGDFITTTEYAGTAGYGLYIWGAQLEVGSYATSYIPTTSASVTRNSDVISRDSLYTNNIVTSNGGTWFVDIINNISLVRDAASNGLFLSTNSTGSVDSFMISTTSGGARLRITKRVGGVLTSLANTTTDVVKIGIRWNGSTADVFINGVEVVTATTFTATDLQYLAHATTIDVPKYLKAMALWPTPLTDDQLTALTTI